MKQFLVLTIAFCMLLVTNTFAQDVAILYDPSLPTLGVNNAAGFANLLVEELKKKNLSAETIAFLRLLDLEAISRTPL